MGLDRMLCCAVEDSLCVCVPAWQLLVQANKSCAAR
jgi:hypothetical protein